MGKNTGKIIIFLILINMLVGCNNIKNINNGMQSDNSQAYETISDEQAEQTSRSGQTEHFEKTEQSEQTQNSAETSKESTTVSMETWIEEMASMRAAGPVFLYDIDADAIPELVISTDEENNNYMYEILDIFGVEPHRMGIINASRYSEESIICGNNYDLYYDESRNEYFYISSVWYKKGNIVIIDKNTVKGDKIYTKKLAQYIYSDIDDKMLYINQGLFLEEEVIKEGYYKIDEINDLLGVTDYLSRYRLIEKDVNMGEEIRKEEQLKEQLRSLCNSLNVSQQNLKLISKPYMVQEVIGADIDNDHWLEYFVHKKSLDKDGVETWAVWKDYLGTYFEMGFLKVNPENRKIDLYIDDAGKRYIANQYTYNGTNQLDMYVLTDGGMEYLEDVKEIDDKKYRFLRNKELENCEISEAVDAAGPTVIYAQDGKMQTTIVTPYSLIVDFMKEQGADRCYLYDFTKDRYPEVLVNSYRTLQPDTQHIINDVVNARNKYIGSITYTNAADTENYTIEYYYDPEKKLQLYYNTVIVDSDETYYQVAESFCWYYRTEYLDDAFIVHDKKIPKTDKAGLDEYIAEVRKDLEKYKFIEIINLDVINSYELLVDGCKDIIKNYPETEPEIEININGTIQKYPWNTYRFEITEEFDWSELNKLPNLKFVKVDIPDTDAQSIDYEKLTSLKDISTLEIVQDLDSYDWISKMDWMQGVTIGKCSDLSFAAALEKLKYISVDIASEKEDITRPLLGNKELSLVTLNNATTAQKEWWENNKN